MRPILNDAEYEEVYDLAREFQRGLGPHLQRYLHLKRTLTTNYVTDWWEQYVYLKFRSPIMVKSNYYGLGRIGYEGQEHFTHKQSASAANLIYSILRWRYDIQLELVDPQAIAGVRPICMSQYRKLFNTTRVPISEDTDIIETYSSEQSTHIIVINKGKFWKVECYDEFSRALTAAELQDQLDLILADKSDPQPGEDTMATLTAGARGHWHHARRKHFLSRQVNARGLADIESSAFVVSLRGWFENREKF